MFLYLANLVFTTLPIPFFWYETGLRGTHKYNIFSPHTMTRLPYTHLPALSKHQTKRMPRVQFILELLLTLFQEENGGSVAPIRVCERNLISGFVVFIRQELVSSLLGSYLAKSQNVFRSIVILLELAWIVKIRYMVATSTPLPVY